MKNIYQRISDVMQEVDYIKKDAHVQGYQAVSHDNVVAQVRSSLIKHGIVIEPHQLKSLLHDKGQKEKNGNIIPDPMRMYEAKYRIDFVNVDNPKDRAKIEVEAHALDNGDKAPGKALSYAVKSAILKIFSIETGVNDESRTFNPSDYSEQQKAQFDELLETKNALDFLCFYHMVGADIFTGLYNSFKQGAITSGKKLCDKLLKEGDEKIVEITINIQECIKLNDPAIDHYLEELNSIEKRLVAARLSSTEIKYLEDLKGKK